MLAEPFSLLNLLHIHLILVVPVLPSVQRFILVLPVQLCPPVSGSGLDTANNTQRPNAIFVLYPSWTCLVHVLLAGVLILGDTLSLAKHSWRCHGAWFQRCRTEISVIHSGISLHRAQKWKGPPGSSSSSPCHHQ